MTPYEKVRAMTEKQAEEADEGPSTPSTEELLVEIRDLLKNNR